MKVMSQKKKRLYKLKSVISKIIDKDLDYEFEENTHHICMRMYKPTPCKNSCEVVIRFNPKDVYTHKRKQG